MRFLLVHKDRVKDARELVDGLGITDAEVLPIGSDNAPTDAVRLRLAVAPPGSSVACIGANRKFQKALAEMATVAIGPCVSTVVGGRVALTEWLCPGGPAQAPGKPADEMNAAVQSVTAGTLVLAAGALNEANNIDAVRHAFVARSARGLAKLAASGSGGLPLADFFQAEQVQFANSGQVRVEVEVFRCGALVATTTTEFHLKQGERTTPERAPRIYFCTVDIQARTYVLVLRCAPHPTASFKVSVYLP